MRNKSCKVKFDNLLIRKWNEKFIKIYMKMKT